MRTERVSVPARVELVHNSKRRGARRFGAWKAYAVILLYASTAAISPAQTFKTLINFDGANGATPVYPGLVQGIDGKLYGTTLGGGANAGGTVFKMTSSGTLTTLYSFCSQPNCTDGTLPQGDLFLGADGNFYGTTSQGGVYAYGTVFKITPEGTLTTLYSFDFTDGDAPFGDLVQATDGNLYGTTNLGGTNGDGTVFKITPQGTLTTLHTFDGADGSFPSGALVQARDGYLYGTTSLGGDSDYGTVFSITAGGTFTTLHSFDSNDGSSPSSGLIQGPDANLYGTTYQGGANTTCNNGCGTVFKISLNGDVTTLYDFDSTHGANPIASLIQATDGNFYGTTYAGGVYGYGYGTIFKITQGGVLTTLHSFDLTHGAQPYGSLAQATSGYFYGTTPYGGASSEGTAFGLAAGLGPFVETNPTSGKVGKKVTILGNNLAGATSVTFNGTAATFKASSTYITTTVPTGATTGTVEVVTPKKTLKSNVPFRVPLLSLEF